MIHDEWTGPVLKNRPDLSPNLLQHTRELMDMHVRDCLVKKDEKRAGSSGMERDLTISGVQRCGTWSGQECRKRSPWPSLATKPEVSLTGTTS